MTGNNLAHQQRDLVGRIELTGLFSCIGSKVADQILIDKAQNIIVLPSVHGNVLNQIKQIPNGLCPGTGAFTQLGQSGKKGLEDVFENTLMRGIDIAVKGIDGIGYHAGLEVTSHIQPGRKQMFIGNKIADILANTDDYLSVIFRQAGQVLIGPVRCLQILDFFFRQEFVKDKAKNVVLIFAGLNFGTHLVGGIPDFGRQLLLVHGDCSSLS